MYAIALYDQVAGRLLLARDPFGIKQLYTAETDLPRLRLRAAGAGGERAGGAASGAAGARPASGAAIHHRPRHDLRRGQARAPGRDAGDRERRHHRPAPARRDAGRVTPDRRRGSGAGGTGSRACRQRRDALPRRRALRSFPLGRHRFDAGVELYGGARRAAGARLHGGVLRRRRRRRARPRPSVSPKRSAPSITRSASTSAISGHGCRASRPGDGRSRRRLCLPALLQARGRSGARREGSC